MKLHFTVKDYKMSIEAEVSEARLKGEKLTKHIRLVCEHTELTGTAKPPKQVKRHISGKWFKRKFRICPVCDGQLELRYVDELFGRIDYAKCKEVACDYEWARYHHYPQD